MSMFRIPTPTLADKEGALDAFNAEAAGEMAAALGRLGHGVQTALAAFDSPPNDDQLRAAAQAVWRYFVQREACGLRDHSDAIRDYGIPPSVLNRLGAR
jgi:hypothetical protein